MIAKFFLLIFIFNICSYKNPIKGFLSLKCKNEYLENLNNKNINKPFKNINNKLNKIEYDTFFVDAINKKIKKAYIPSESLFNRDRIIFENKNNSISILFKENFNINNILIVLSLANDTEINYISDSNFFYSVYSKYYYFK